MKSKTKYLLLILAIAGLGLSYYNHYNALTVTSFDPVELKYAKIFCGVGILCAGIYFFTKSLRNILTKMMIGAFGICLALNLYLFVQVFGKVQL